ncbi:armadillo-type protein [Gorgonomyces haynaldii]|nr:armadillo-type protein [Gorgonomyces haynaldii]
MSEEDFDQLSLQDRLEHKVWKARQSGYQELLKQFKSFDLEDKQSFEQYHDYLKNMVTDSNQIAQESGVACLLQFVQDSPTAHKTTHLIPLIVDKCLASTRAGTRTNALEILLRYCEIETPNSVLESVLPGLDHKTPKNVASCVGAIKEILKGFGIPSITIKPLIKHLPKLFDHRDKTVRQEAAELTVEIYKWVGPALMSSLQDLKPVQLKELNAVFETIAPEKPVATRSKQESQPATKPSSPSSVTTAAEPEPVISAYDLADPVAILDKIPKSFFSDMQSTAWKERKEALENLLTIVSHPKLEDGRYNDLVNILAKKLADPNIIVAVLAANCLEKLALGLRKAFGQYRPVVIPPCLERMKEKKTNVIDALRAVLDATFAVVTIQDVLEDTIVGMTHKNPQVKTESLQFFIRSIKKSKKEFPKPELKRVVELLLKLMEDSVDAVRDAAAEALANMQQSIGERSMSVYLERLDKVKLSKVQEMAQKLASPGAKAITPPRSKASSVAKEQEKPKPPLVKQISKPMITKPVIAKPKTIKKVEEPVVEQIRHQFTDDSAQMYCEEHLPQTSKLADSQWKTRLEGMNEILETVQAQELKAEAVIRCLLVKPGWKESNFQVSTVMCNVFGVLTSKPSFDAGCAVLLISGLAAKLGDMKIKKPVGECLDKIADKSGLELVLSESYDTLAKQKSPKFLADGLLWINNSLKEFGVAGVKVRALIDFLKTCLANTNNVVRGNATIVLGSVRRIVGPTVRDLLNDLSPQVLATVDAEFEKVAAQSPIKPKKVVPEAVSISDELFPKVDLSAFLTQQLIDRMGDSAWKERKAALDEIVQKVNEARNIHPQLPSDFVTALKQRLSDSNKNIASTAVELTGLLATAMGSSFDRYNRQLIQPMLAQLTDQKAQIRANVLTNLDKIAGAIDFNQLTGPVASALAQENPILRKDLLKWICDQSEKWTDWNALILPCLQIIQDRNIDVRKQNQALLSHLASKVDNAQIEAIASDNFKGAALSTVKAGLENVIVKTESKPERQEEPKPELQKRASKIMRSTSQISLKKEKEQPVDTLPPLLDSDLKAKESRASMDKGLNKWAFETPRKELVDLLQEQCQGHLNPSVIALLFSTDHYKEKDFMAGLKILDDFMIEFGLEKQVFQQRCVSVCDLLFKYLTIRFFDTNTSLLLKCVEFLEHYLNVLDEAGYLLSEYEASCFLPFFIAKVGDPKESMRLKLRGVLKQLARVYPVSKLFVHLLKGLDSKNSRTRTECLEELASLMQRNGLTAFSPSKALPLIAAQMGDRDASVRNACLTAITQAYFLLGDEAFKYMSHLAEKDVAMIQERIKRLPAQKAPEPLKEKPKKKIDLDPSIPVRKEFSLDFENFGMAQLKKENSGSRMTLDNGTSRLNLDHATSRLNLEHGTSKMTLDHAASRMTLDDRSVLDDRMSRLSEDENLAGKEESLSDERLELLVDVVITKVASASADEGLEALKQLEKVMNMYPEKIQQRSNDIVGVLTLRSRASFGGDLVTQPKQCKYLVNILVILFSNQSLAYAVTPDTLEQCIREVLTRLVDPGLQSVEAGASIARLLNVLMVRVIENSRPNFVFKALLRVLQESALSEDVNFKHTELVMKCLWKITKVISELISGRKLIVEDLLFDVNEFFNTAPPQVWKKRAAESKTVQADMPLRTVKTILHEIVNHLGAEIMNYAAVLPNQQGHLVTYLRQMVLNLEKKNKGQMLESPLPQKNAEATDMSKALDEIFAKISDKAQTKHGIQQLYEFQKQHPGAYVYVEQRLAQTGSYFQGYIRRGLAAISQSENDTKMVQETKQAPVQGFVIEDR